MGTPVTDDELTPEEESSQEVLAAAERFFEALANGDGRALWAVMSDDARAYVLNIAVERSMEFDLYSRLRDGTASEEEVDSYLADLLEGIRADLQGVKLDRLAFESAAEPESPMRMRVTYLMRMDATIGGVETAIPAGSLIMVHEDGEWKMDRLVPRPG